MNHLPPDPWVQVSEVIAIIQDPKWSWVRNAPCKYVEVRIDTRDMCCRIYDRDRREITLTDLARQLDN